MYIFIFFSTGKCLTTLLLFTFCLTCDNRPTKTPKTHTFMKKIFFLKMCRNRKYHKT